MRTRILPVVRKELREIRRDRITLSIALGLPIVLLVLFGYAIRLEVDDVRTAVLDLDRSPESAALAEAFENSGDFLVIRWPETERAATRLVDAGEVVLVLVVPRGFARELHAGRTAHLQAIIDGTFSSRAVILRNEVDALVLWYSLDRARHLAGGVTPSEGIRTVPRIWYNPALRSRTAVVPGLFAVILMAFPPLLTALAVVREKESGSVQQIYVSPLRPWEFIAGKMLPYVGIALVELAMLVALGTWWFGIPFHGGLPTLLAGAVLYVFCTVGIGLLVSTLTRRQVVAVFLSLILTVMPSFLFSGFLYPISSMPAAVQWYTRLFPARYFTEVSRGVFLRGAGLAELWDELAWLAAYTAVVFAAATRLFRKKVA